MRIILHIVISTLAVVAAAYVIPGVSVSGWIAAMVVAIVLGILNTFLKPILLVLTLPLNILTLGLFTLVINTLLVLLAGVIVPGFHPGSFFAALLFGILLSLINMFVNSLKD